MKKTTKKQLLALGLTGVMALTTLISMPGCSNPGSETIRDYNANPVVFDIVIEGAEGHPLKITDKTGISDTAEWGPILAKIKTLKDSPAVMYALDNCAKPVVIILENVADYSNGKIYRYLTDDNEAFVNTKGLTEANAANAFGQSIIKFSNNTTVKANGIAPQSYLASAKPFTARQEEC